MNRFEKSAFRQKVDRLPVWFMRQAGRYMPQYNKIRSELSFLELCRDVDKCIEISLLPLDLLSVDAVIVFSDILLPLEAMGLELEFTEQGPEILNPIRSESDCARLKSISPTQDTPAILRTLSGLRKRLGNDFPIIGFSGAPFTLLSYMVEGHLSKDKRIVKQMMYEHPATFRKLLRHLTQMTQDYLVAQIEAGASAVQVFDSWIGALDEPSYRRFVLEEMRGLFDALKKYNVPRILFGMPSMHLLKAFKEVQPDVLSLDWRTPLSHARQQLGSEIALQGNMDPAAFFMPMDDLKTLTQGIIREMGPETGYIFNVGHGILPKTPLENVQAVVKWVKEFGTIG